jgi:hypothetical protein
LPKCTRIVADQQRARLARAACSIRLRNDIPNAAVKSLSIEWLTPFAPEKLKECMKNAGLIHQKSFALFVKLA